MPAPDRRKRDVTWFPTRCPKPPLPSIWCRRSPRWIAASLPSAVREKCVELLIDVVGLAVTARHEDYVQSVVAACDDDGPCTAIGHGRTLSAAAAALVNGTAIHGEDFDDTFEGGPIHAGAVVVVGGAGGLRAAQVGTAKQRCSASPSASRPCAGCRRWRRCSPTKRAFIRPRCSARSAPPPASALRSSSRRGS